MKQRKLIRITKVSATVEKDHEIVSDPDITEGQISESIAKMQAVFTRMKAMDGAIESLPSEEEKEI